MITPAPGFLLTFAFGLTRRVGEGQENHERRKLALLGAVRGVVFSTFTGHPTFTLLPTPIYGWKLEIGHDDGLFLAELEARLRETVTGLRGTWQGAPTESQPTKLAEALPDLATAAQSLAGLQVRPEALAACPPGCEGDDSESYCVLTQGPYCGRTNPELVTSTTPTLDSVIQAVLDHRHLAAEGAGFNEHINLWLARNAMLGAAEAFLDERKARGAPMKPVHDALARWLKGKV